MFGDDDMFYSRTTRQYLYHISPLMPIYPSGSETKVHTIIRQVFVMMCSFEYYLA